MTLGIRPRSFEFVDPGTTDALHATVDLTEPMGAETLAHLIEQGADMRCVVPEQRRARDGRSGRRPLQGGSTPCVR